MDHKTYVGQESLTRLPQTLREFGEQQNRFNGEMKRSADSCNGQIEVLAEQIGVLIEQVKALETELSAAKQRITELENEQQLNIKRFHRCAEELDRAEKETNRLKLTTKLNSNAIDRLMK